MIFVFLSDFTWMDLDTTHFCPITSETGMFNSFFSTTLWGKSHWQNPTISFCLRPGLEDFFEKGLDSMLHFADMWWLLSQLSSAITMWKPSRMIQTLWMGLRSDKILFIDTDIKISHKLNMSQNMLYFFSYLKMGKSHIWAC